MLYDEKRAVELLRKGCGDAGAIFRSGQEALIQGVLDGPKRSLVVQRTGWGKSFVYFIAIKLLRESGRGPALLISPLLSLMRNQLLAAERMGVRAATIHSANRAEWPAIVRRLSADELDVLLVSPERLSNAEFAAEVLGTIAARVSLLVVDEAHCVSDWGHDFRPHYRFLDRLLRGLPQNIRVLATTATANRRVLADLESIVGPDLAVARGPLCRPSLVLQTLNLESAAARMAWMATHIPMLEGSGIVYTLTVRDACRVAAWLQNSGVHAEAYTSESQDREALERALLDNKIKALVATLALGMGFDKPDLSFVIHYQAPGSVVTYYQQVGRAGRAIPAAHAVLLGGSEDERIQDYFIESAFPSKGEVWPLALAMARLRGASD